MGILTPWEVSKERRRNSRVPLQIAYAAKQRVQSKRTEKEDAK